MLETVSWIGILFMLLVTGLEVNFSSVLAQKDKATAIAFYDTIIPVVLSVPVLWWLPDAAFASERVALPLGMQDKWLAVLFLSAIMTISALPVSIRAMHEVGILKTDLGFLAISALSLNDIFGWVFFQSSWESSASVRSICFLWDRLPFGRFSLQARPLPSADGSWT